MTADELQRIVLRLANSSHVRYWVNYGDRHENVVMAIQAMDFLVVNGKASVVSIEIKDLEHKGFTPLHRAGVWFYTIPRTNDDGTPYVSKLF